MIAHRRTLPPQTSRNQEVNFLIVVEPTATGILLSLQASPVALQRTEVETTLRDAAASSGLRTFTATLRLCLMSCAK